MKDAQFDKVTITTIDGKLVLEKNIQKTDRAQLDVSRFANGVYLINILTKEGQLFTEKLMKN
jgi:hypothetical protein